MSDEDEIPSTSKDSEAFIFKDLSAAQKMMTTFTHEDAVNFLKEVKDSFGEVEGLDVDVVMWLHDGFSETKIEPPEKYLFPAFLAESARRYKASTGKRRPGSSERNKPSAMEVKDILACVRLLIKKP